MRRVRWDLIAIVAISGLATFSASAVAWLRATDAVQAVCHGQNEIRAQLTESVQVAIPRTRETLDELIASASTPEERTSFVHLLERSEDSFRESLQRYRQRPC